jgi:hypothetical protein
VRILYIRVYCIHFLVNLPTGRGWLASSIRGLGLRATPSQFIMLYNNGLRVPNYIYLLKSFIYLLLLLFFFFWRMCQWLRGSVVVVVVVLVAAVIGRRKTMGTHTTRTTHTYTYTRTRRHVVYLRRTRGDPFRMHRNARRSFRPRAPPKRTWSKLANTIESPFCI